MTQHEKKFERLCTDLVNDNARLEQYQAKGWDLQVESSRALIAKLIAEIDALEEYL